MLVSQVTELEDNMNCFKKDSIQKYSTINEELTKTKQQLEFSQLQLTDAYSKLEEELLSQKEITEFIQQEMKLTQEVFDTKSKEQQSSLARKFQLLLAKQQKEVEEIESESESELKSEIDQVTAIVLF